MTVRSTVISMSGEPTPDGEKPTRATRAAAALLFILAIAVLRNLTGPWLSTYADVAAGLAAATVTAAAALWWARHHHHRIGLTNWTSGLAHGAGFAAIVAAGLAAAIIIPQTRAALVQNAPDTYPRSMWITAALLIVPASTVVFEELLFRGVLWGYISEHLSPTKTLLATTTAFAIWHIPAVLLDPQGVAGTATSTPTALAQTLAVTFTGGLAFGWLRMRTGSLAAPVMAHTATNSFGYLALAIAT